MLNHRTLLTALVIGLVAFAFTAAFAADAKPVRIAGQLTKIDGMALTITEGGKDTVVTCNEATKINRDGSSTPLKFEDLKVGQHIRAYCTPTDHVALHVHIFKTGV